MSSLTTEEKANLAYYYLKRKYPDFEQKPGPDPIVVDRPTTGYVKPGNPPGWGGNPDPDNWTITAMKDKPQLFKIVDDKNVNIATDFPSKEVAKQYIDWYLANENPEDTIPGPGPEPIGTDGPYKSIGQELKHTIRGPTIRHYSSGKEDDKTIEANVKNIKFNHYQFLVDAKLTTIEHEDTLSLKYGGTHMKSGWFDNTIDFGKPGDKGAAGLVALGTEKKHPSAQLRIVKGKKIGDILNKKVRVAGVYFKDQNKCEMWTHDGTNWVKQVEGVDVNGFNPKSEINEAQLRIDGFEAVPDITRAVVQEIA